MITGGAGLIGTEFSNAIAEQNGLVVIADKNLESAEGVARLINQKYPNRALPVFLDITKKESILSLIKTVSQSHTRIDALINNAYPRNKHYGRALEDVSYEDFCENVNLHLGGYFLVAQQFASFFKQQGHGNIINLSSIYGVRAPQFDIYTEVNFTMPVEYAAIKSAVHHLTLYFAQYFKKDGIRVNSLSPGGVFDNQPEPFLKKYKNHCGNQGMLKAQDLCGSLVFLLSDASKHITGQNLIVDDGFTL